MLKLSTESKHFMEPAEDNCRPRIICQLIGQMNERILGDRKTAIAQKT
jgi:hypothetical protein